MKKFIYILLKLFIFGALTILTQIGGIVYLISEFLFIKKNVSNKLKRAVGFIVLYLFITLLIIPYLAPFFGREKIKHTNCTYPTNYMTVILNRNYVRPELNILLANIEKNLQHTNVSIHYLDANFPFINKFPLLPHLSHNDGKKIDISLIYETYAGEITRKQKSISGYGIFESPKSNEYNQINVCQKKGYFQYDFPKYLTFGKVNTDLVFSQKGTKTLINAITKENRLGKIFIEPHLKIRLGLSHHKIRYHGCGAVRHDDHIHIQLK